MITLNAGRAMKNFTFKDEGNDMFALPHLGDLINLPPIETTYRSMSG